VECRGSIGLLEGGVVDQRPRKAPSRSRLWGYALAGLTKPIFPLAPSIGWVFAGPFVDRVIRGAPRDALGHQSPSRGDRASGSSGREHPPAMLGPY
jgi:hypothetical protein